MAPTLADAVSRFGRDVKAALNDPAASGEPEEQLRTPLVNLIADLNALIGLAADGVRTVGEVRLSDLATKPDYAVTRGGLIGFIELKAPGKGSDPRGFAQKSADRAQWEKLKALPNLIYTNGNGFFLWQDGRPHAAVAIAAMQRRIGLHASRDERADLAPIALIPFTLAS